MVVQPTKTTRAILAADEEWMRSIDLAAVKRDVRKLGARLAAEQGPADVAHLNKLLLWMNLLNAAGTLTAGLFRPGTLLFLPAIALSVAITARWTMCEFPFRSIEKGVMICASVP